MKTLAVVGGGAAGFFCAVNAARLAPGLKVIILEKSNKLLSKVKISGGGRCNVTHDCSSIAEMAACYPRGNKFVKKAFHHYFVSDTINWFLERDVDLKSEPDGRMFPVSDSSQTIIDCLLREASRFSIEIRMQTEVKGLRFESDKWILNCADRNIIADDVCIASGGFPKAQQFDWLRSTGHTFADPVPSLFTFNMPGNPITSLMGVAVEATVKINGSKLSETGSVLITHWGLSGPAVLKLSAWAARELNEEQYNFSITVNWLPATNENNLIKEMQQHRFSLASQKIVNRNPFGLPVRLWQYHLQQCGINEDIRWADLPAKQQNMLVKNLCSQSFIIKGKTTYKEEFVTAGGISLSEVDVNTMRSKLQPHLFFAGEIIDVDGITGGYNFQNAWTTGFIAASAIASGKALEAHIS